MKSAKLLILFLFPILALPLAAAPQPVKLGPAPQLNPKEIEQRMGVDLKQGPPETTEAFVPPVDTQNPRAVAAHSQAHWFTLLEAFNLNWNGNVLSCDPGALGLTQQQAVIQAVNYFRSMTGLPGNVVLDEALSRKNQDTALMMIANAQLSHFPEPDWPCFTQAGAEAAANSNLALGRYGPSAVAGYMEDSGTGNTAVGHRRWILFPPQQIMGTGDTDAQNSRQGLNFFGSNALWVIGNFGTRPNEPEFAAWPPSGYVPYQLVYQRWSFSLANADFSNTSVSVHQGDARLTIEVLPIQEGFGDNTIVWEVPEFILGQPDGAPTYTVHLEKVMIGGEPRSFNYEVKIFDHSEFLGSAVRDWAEMAN